MVGANRSRRVPIPRTTTLSKAGVAAMKRPRPVRAMSSVCIALIGWFVAAGPMASIGGQPTPTAPEARTIALNDANAMEAEFRIGAAGKILVEFKFADGKTLKLE